MFRIFDRVSGANSVVSVLMIPGRSTSTIRCNPGPLTVIEITSVETVFLVFFIRNSTSCLKSAKSASLVRSNSREESFNCAI